jgi:hypothetical protein
MLEIVPEPSMIEPLVKVKVGDVRVIRFVAMLESLMAPEPLVVRLAPISSRLPDVVGAFASSIRCD